MKNYLDTTLRPGVTVVIKDVAYYPETDKKLYDCEFQVTMRSGEKDPTGTVAATISNDFLKVTRTR